MGIDRRFDPERTARVLREVDADVVGVQEIGSPRHRTSDAWTELADLTGYAPIPGPTRLRRGSAFGNGILTRLPVLDHALVDLSVPRREPRGAIDATLECDGVGVRMVVTHFGLSRAERREQGLRLLARIAECDAALSVLVGDFNEWFVASASLGRLRAALGREIAVPSFPAPLPVLALDRIWIRPGSALERVAAHRSRSARLASDHLPVVADVRVPS